MLAIVKLINILIELLQVLINKRTKAKRDEEVRAIRNDPAAEFECEFSGLPVDECKASVPGDKAGADINPKE